MINFYFLFFIKFRHSKNELTITNNRPGFIQLLRLIDMHGIEILTTKNQSYSKEIQQLKEENLRLRIVNEYVKKLSALDQEDQKK